MTTVLILFAAAFALNLVWEYFHSRLYETCRNMERGAYHRLMWSMSAKDAIEICVFYGIAAALFHQWNIMNNLWALVVFALLALGFAFVDETISIRRGHWQYSDAMPLVLGVGVTPLLELVVTGLVALFIIFR